MFRAVLQNVDLFWVIFFYLAFTLGCRSAHTDSCHEVKTVYVMRQIGQVEMVPDSPQTDDSLRVCVHSGPGCCTSKMEDSYMAAVRSETQQKMRSYSFELKYLITGHSKAYEDTFNSLVSFTSNLTSTLFDSAYSNLASDCRPHVLQLFNVINRHLSGDPNSSLEHAVGSFFNDLFPLVYRRLLNPGIGHTSPQSFSSSSSPSHEDCLRMTRQDVSPFGPHPRLLVSSLSRALGVGRTLSQLLRLAGDVVDATEKATLSRECGRGLVRMQYCSHCRGLTLIRPCTGLCVNVMRGCLVGISELAAPWKSLVILLQRLAATLATSSNHNSMELALLAVRNHVNDAILHAQLHGPRITAIVQKVCGSQADGPVMISGHPNTSHVTTPTARMTQRPSKRVSMTSLSMGYGAYASLQLPSQSYAGRVVGSTLKAQRDNPEMTVRNTDPVLKAAKQKLEQLTQEVLVELGWAHEATRKGDEEDGGSAETDRGSGDNCDDEDGCEASGINTDDLSSGHSPVTKDRTPLLPPHHRIPPRLNSPSLVPVTGSASMLTLKLLYLSLATLLLLLSPWQPC
ncbi:glypican-5-like isoform X2 [Vanacampus margaritifer]